MNLTDFLLARIAEDEQSARDELRDGYGDMNRCESGWSSGRVLAECDAKRRIAELHRPSPDDDPKFLPYCVGCWEEGGEDGAPTYPCRTLRFVALPYADHPDYDEGWRP